MEMKIKLSLYNFEKKNTYILLTENKGSTVRYYDAMPHRAVRVRGRLYVRCCRTLIPRCQLDETRHESEISQIKRDKTCNQLVRSPTPARTELIETC